MEKRSVKQKKAWKNIEITRVKLNPEQAVLSCCDSSTKNEQTGTNQCHDIIPICSPTGSAYNALSS